VGDVGTKEAEDDGIRLFDIALQEDVNFKIEVKLQVDEDRLRGYRAGTILHWAVLDRK
jgi:hypothetical protein